MKLGTLFVVLGSLSFVALLVMAGQGHLYVRGFVGAAGTVGFGLHLISRARRKKALLKAVKDWARDNPEAARRWLEEQRSK
jgi:hypothetical protein